ncbi:MAG: DUF2294 domain-containing protein [Nitrospirae bacterium]|nr:MAG: DUF2294 domain-containing protein [Nitrospirota bacterium]
MEHAIKQAIIRFEYDFMGRGPTEVRVFIVQDMVVIRLKGVLTPAERQLAKTSEGIGMVKQMRQNLLFQGRETLIKQIEEITGATPIALFTDIDVQTGERMIIFTLDRDLTKSFSRRIALA